MIIHDLFPVCEIASRESSTLERPQPVLVRVDGRFLTSEGSDNIIYVQNNQSIIPYCSVGFTNAAKEKRLDVKCLGSDTYEVAQLSATQQKTRGHLMARTDAQFVVARRQIFSRT